MREDNLKDRRVLRIQWMQDKIVGQRTNLNNSLEWLLLQFSFQLFEKKERFITLKNLLIFSSCQNSLIKTTVFVVHTCLRQNRRFKFPKKQRFSTINSWKWLLNAFVVKHTKSMVISQKFKWKETRWTWTNGWFSANNSISMKNSMPNISSKPTNKPQSLVRLWIWLNF